MKENKQENEIVKETVVGFIVTANKFGYFYTHPLTGSWCGSPDLPCGQEHLDISSEERVIGILPAPPNTFKVTGCNNISNTCISLGYEYEGAYHPDWADEHKRTKHGSRCNDPHEPVEGDPPADAE